MIRRGEYYKLWKGTPIFNFLPPFITETFRAKLKIDFNASDGKILEEIYKNHFFAIIKTKQQFKRRIAFNFNYKFIAERRDLEIWFDLFLIVETASSI